MTMWYAELNRDPETPERPPLDARMDGECFVGFLEVPRLLEPPTLSFRRDTLVIEGFQRSGTRARAFQREIGLPTGVDRDRLQLEYIAGVLRIEVPPESPQALGRVNDDAPGGRRSAALRTFRARHQEEGDPCPSAR